MLVCLVYIGEHYNSTMYQNRGHAQMYQNSTVYCTRGANHVPMVHFTIHVPTMDKTFTSVYCTKWASHVPSIFKPYTRIALCTIQERPAMYHPCTNHVPCTKIALVCTIQEGPTMYHPSEKECVTRNSREYKLIHWKLFFFKIKL